MILFRSVSLNLVVSVADILNDIIEKWMTTKNPQTCPHGRPISKIIETKEIRLSYTIEENHIDFNLTVSKGCFFKHPFVVSGEK